MSTLDRSTIVSANPSSPSSSEGADDFDWMEIASEGAAKSAISGGSNSSQQDAFWGDQGVIGGDEAVSGLEVGISGLETAVSGLDDQESGVLDSLSGWAESAMHEEVAYESDFMGLENSGGHVEADEEVLADGFSDGVDVTPENQDFPVTSQSESEGRLVGYGQLETEQYGAVQAGQFGAGQSRTSETEARYLSRASWLWARYGRETGLGDAQLTVMGFASWLSGLREGLQKSSWRQYKSAAIYWLRSARGDPESQRAADVLEGLNSAVCMAEPGRTSSLRRKNITDEDLRDFLSKMDGVQSSHGRYMALTKTWVMLGAITGLRPHEWSQAQMVREVQPGSDWEIKEGLTAGRTYLRVRNSKHTNGRAHGEFRHLDVTEFGESVWVSMDAFVRFMSSDPTRVRYKKIYTNCYRFLLDANKHIFGEFAPRIHLYSARHRFASEAKSQWKPREVAAAMGHGNDHTAYSMYGNAWYSSGRRLAEPVEGEVDRVKRANKGETFLGKQDISVQDENPDGA